MTVQWMLVAAFLYSEIILIILLLLPFISPRIWNKIFHSRICQFVTDRANLYFSIFIAVLVLFFVDAIREVRKYSSDHSHVHLDAETHTHLKLYRSQRNFYISGFALFLWFVIRRLLTLVSSQASLIDENESIRKEAQSSTEQSQRLLKEKEEREKSFQEYAENLGNAKQESHEEDIRKLKSSLLELANELTSAKLDLDTSKLQIETVSKDYDSLLKENLSLHNTLESVMKSEGDKKEE